MLVHKGRAIIKIKANTPFLNVSEVAKGAVSLDITKYTKGRALTHLQVCACAAHDRSV